MRVGSRGEGRGEGRECGLQEESEGGEQGGG